MSKNYVRKTFYGDGTWTAPAGVKKIRVSAMQVLPPTLSGSLTSIALTYPSLAAYAWGNNASGQVGAGTVTTDYSSPILVLGGYSWRSVSSGSSTTGGTTLAGDAYAMGVNTSGQIGDGTVVDKSSPTLVLGGFKWRQLTVGSSSTLGLSAQGDVYGWGANTQGQLGQNDVTPKSSPVIMLGGYKWKSITNSFGTSFLGVTTSGDAYACGNNDNGQLGTGNVTKVSSPVLVLGGYKWDQVGISNVSYGVTTDGVAYTWGQNTSGQMGDGTVIPKSSPTLVLGGYKWKYLAHGLTNSMIGITTDGDAYAWGANANGQLGDGTTVSKSSPTLIVGGYKWASIRGSIGITTSGDLYAWGDNGQGQLGDGTVVSKSSPVLVLGGFRYPTVYTAQANSVQLNVVPGSTYNIVTLGLVAAFGAECLYQDPYNSGSVQLKVTLEYDA